MRSVQRILIAGGYLDPPADGGFGPVTKWALHRFSERVHLRPTDQLTPEIIAALKQGNELPLTPGDDLAGKIVRAMVRNNYWIARHPACANIVYIEGMNMDGSPNDNRNNVFNDVRLVFRIREGGEPFIVGQWEATTEPSRLYTLHPMNAGGAFHIAFGQYKAWTRGWYHTHEALLQSGEIHGFRDINKTFKRDYSHPVQGANFGVHQHWGYDMPLNDEGNSSAGCLVGRSTAGHRQFMSIVCDDPRFQANPNYKFMTAIIPVADLGPTNLVA